MRRYPYWEASGWPNVAIQWCSPRPIFATAGARRVYRQVNHEGTQAKEESGTRRRGDAEKKKGAPSAVIAGPPGPADGRPEDKPDPAIHAAPIAMHSGLPGQARQ